MNVFSKIKISHKLLDAIILLAILAASLMPRLMCSKAKNIFIAKSKKRLTPDLACSTVFYGAKLYGPRHDALVGFFTSFWASFWASFGVRAITAPNCERIGVQAHHVSVDGLFGYEEDLVDGKVFIVS